MSNYQATSTLEDLECAYNYNQALECLVLKYAPKNKSAKVLDFGAGIGTFSTRIASHGYKVDCFEIDEGQCELLKKKSLNVFRSLSEIENGSLDYIYSLNVIEHIEDDLNTVASLIQKIRPGGKIFIFVPAFQILFSKFDSYLGHHRRYTIESLSNLINDLPVTVEKKSYFDTLGFFAAVVFKTLGYDQTKVNEKTVIFFDRLVFPFNKFFDLFTKSFFGKNVYMVLRKR